MKIEEFAPIDDRVVVRPHQPDEKTEAGVYLPPAALTERREVVQSGEVVAIGPGRLTSDGRHEAMMDLEIGDTVYYARFQGWLFTTEEDGKEVEYRIFGQHDLFGRRRRDDE